MRKILFLALVALPFIGCKKVNPEDIHEYKETRVQYTERISMKFPSIISINIPWLDIGIFDVNADFEEKYKSNNPYLHLVEDVRPVKIKSILVRPQNKTFDFLKDKRVYITAPGQPKLLLATVTNLPSNVGNELYLIPEDVVLDNYMNENMDMDIEVTADRSLLQEVEVVVEMTVDARVKN